jgi:thiosulfate dehydrogenase
MTLIRIRRAALMALCALLALPVAAQDKDKRSPAIWTVPDINALPDDSRGRLVRHGRDLITMTYAYMGPHAADRDTRFAGNNLACGNCHLEATKKFGLPIFGLAWDFPRYSARTGANISIEDRLNSCMTRSMNGRPLPDQLCRIASAAAKIRA